MSNGGSLIDGAPVAYRDLLADGSAVAYRDLLLQDEYTISQHVDPLHFTEHQLSKVGKRSICIDFLSHPVRVRWVDHKCKVNSDEFDEEATLCSW
jgi:hypothetical protein